MIENHRNVPKLPQSFVSDYARYLGCGFDTIVETFNTVMPDGLISRLENSKKAAQAADERGDAMVSLDFGGEELQIASHGGRGTMFILSCPDFSVDIRSPKTDWNISVRYSAAGLWQYGSEKLRARVHAMLIQAVNPIDNERGWITLSSAHVAFDFFSPRMTADMKPEMLNNLVAHSESKNHVNFKMPGSAWGRARGLETITVGKKNNVEVQIYDKGKEITDLSGKDWMLKHWRNEPEYVPEVAKLKHIWRLELRFGKKFLKDRRVDTFEDFKRNLSEIVAEAIYTKRLTWNNRDTNFRRRPLHPIWSRALDEAGAAVHMLPIGRQIEMSGEAYAAMMRQNAAGCARAAIVAQKGTCETASEFITFAVQAGREGFEDPLHDKKVAKLAERTKHLNVARS